MKIGCKQYTFEEWFNFEDSFINSMDDYALEFWNTYKIMLQNFTI